MIERIPVGTVLTERDMEHYRQLAEDQGIEFDDLFEEDFTEEESTEDDDCDEQ